MIDFSGAHEPMSAASMWQYRAATYRKCPEGDSVIIPLYQIINIILHIPMVEEH